jgi:N-acetylneuraminic acid mutarotase
MPTARGYAGVAAVGGKIYILGGFDGARALTVNEVYFPDRDDGSGRKGWEKAAPLPHGCYAMGIFNLADNIFLIGGEGSEEKSPIFLEYSITLDSWQALDSKFTRSFSHSGTVLLGPRVYVVGGQSEGITTQQTFTYQAIYTISIPLIK